MNSSFNKWANKQKMKELGSPERVAEEARKHQEICREEQRQTEQKEVEWKAEVLKQPGREKKWEEIKMGLFKKKCGVWIVEGVGM